MSIDWKTQKSLVLGGSGGIGKSLVVALKERGSDVFGTFNTNPSALKDILDERHIFRSNWDNSSQFDSDIKSILELFPEPDFVFLSAGSAYFGPLTEMRQKDLEHLVQVDLVSPIEWTKAWIPHLKSKGKAHIHIVSAIAGLVPAVKNMAVYTACKFGLVGFVRAMQWELMGSGITISVSCPSGVKTSLGKNAHGQKDEFLKLLSSIDKNFEDPNTVANGILDSLENREPVHLPTEMAKKFYQDASQKKFIS
jgi:short-subunit dehydrogenase